VLALEELAADSAPWCLSTSIHKPCAIIPSKGHRQRISSFVLHVTDARCFSGDRCPDINLDTFVGFFDVRPMKMQTSLGFVPLVILFLKLSPSALAIDPPPDGGYPGGNTAEGQNALLSLTSGMYNTAVGFDSLVLNAAGNFNTGVGAGALLTNVGDPTTGDGVENTAIGAGALLSNSAGSRNTAIGAFALFNNIGGDGADGSLNTAVGDSALLNNTTGAATSRLVTTRSIQTLKASTMWPMVM
jgi:hypothetical protein